MPAGILAGVEGAGCNPEGRCPFPVPLSIPSHPGDRGVPRPSPDRCGCSGLQETCSALAPLGGTGHPHHLHGLRPVLPLCHSSSFYYYANDNSGLIRGFGLVG